MPKKYTYQEAHCPLALLTNKLKTVNPICLDILYSRGLRTTEDMEEFLFPSLSRSLRRHPAMLDMDKAIAILTHAVKQKIHTVVYHDYDVDGVTSAAIFTECMETLGVPVSRYCNDRVSGGFGINAAGVDELMRRYPDTKLLVTVDNGITGVEGVQRAKELGLTVIVTDHHEPGDFLPAADAVIDHKRKDEPENQYRDNCGAGVIWKVMLALYSALGRDVKPVMDTLDFATLGTVADIVPLSSENRAIVQEGLQVINSGTRPFFRVLAETMKFQTIDSETISYQIAPMINAVSRMNGDASSVVKLLLNTDEQSLREGIIELDDYNQARRQETTREVELAATALGDNFDKPVVIFKDASLQEGIVGIVAGQLKEQLGRPALVFAQDKDGNWKGSCRSMDGFNIKEALDQCAEYLIAYGGHAKAAGVTVKADCFPAFQAKMEQLASEAVIAEKSTVIDAVLPSDQYTERMVRELGILAPFGEGFQKPVFGLVADIVDMRFMGQEQQHVKYIDRTGLAVIQWGQGEQVKLRKKVPCKFVGYPQLNSWNGTVSVQFVCH